MRDYLAWHDDYERPGSALHLRLLVVQDLIATALDEAPAGRVRVISMCAGQGRDLVTAVRRHRRGGDVAGRLVEIDPRNIHAARAAIADSGIDGLEIVEADAGRSDAYLGAVPADLVLACGVFGNISDDDVRATIEFMPALCSVAAWVLWTRAPRSDGILDKIQGWFDDAGFAPKALVVGEGDLFAVGAAQFRGSPADLQPGIQLFEFLR